MKGGEVATCPTLHTGKGCLPANAIVIDNSLKKKKTWFLVVGTSDQCLVIEEERSKTEKRKKKENFKFGVEIER